MKPPTGWRQISAAKWYKPGKWHLHRVGFQPRHPAVWELWTDAPRPKEGGAADSRCVHRGSLEQCIEFAEAAK